MEKTIKIIEIGDEGKIKRLGTFGNRTIYRKYYRYIKKSKTIDIINSKSVKIGEYKIIEYGYKRGEDEYYFNGNYYKRDDFINKIIEYDNGWDDLGEEYNIYLK